MLSGILEYGNRVFPAEGCKCVSLWATRASDRPEVLTTIVVLRIA